MEKIKLTASDREALIRLNVAYEILQTEGEHLQRRFRAIEGGAARPGDAQSKDSQADGARRRHDSRRSAHDLYSLIENGEFYRRHQEARKDGKRR